MLTDIKAWEHLWGQIKRIEWISSWTALSKQVGKESEPLKELIDANISKIRTLAKQEGKLKNLESIKKITELNDEDSTIALLDLMWKSSADALKVKEIIRKEIWEKSYEQLLAIKAFSKISNIKNAWSIASQALNVSVAATALWTPLGLRGSLAISQFLGQPKKMAWLLIDWELKRKWTSNVSKELVKYVSEWKPLTEKMWDLFTWFSDDTTSLIK